MMKILQEKLSQRDYLIESQRDIICSYAFSSDSHYMQGCNSQGGADPSNVIERMSTAQGCGSLGGASLSIILERMLTTQDCGSQEGACPSMVIKWMPATLSYDSQEEKLTWLSKKMMMRVSMQIIWVLLNIIPMIMSGGLRTHMWTTMMFLFRMNY